MFYETYAQRDGTIARRSTSDTGFAATPQEWVLSGPHFFLANPFNKTQRKVCTANGHYDVIDLETLPDDYLPHTDYLPMADRTTYLHPTPGVSWIEKGRPAQNAVTGYFQMVIREMMGTFLGP